MPPAVAWEAVLLTPATWDALADFWFIGLLSRTSRLSRAAMRDNATAWERVAAIATPLPARCARRVFCLSAYDLARVQREPGPIASERALRLGLAKHGSVAALCDRHARQTHATTRWPQHVLAGRILPLLAEVLGPGAHAVLNTTVMFCVLGAARRHISQAVQLGTVMLALRDFADAVHARFGRSWWGGRLRWHGNDVLATLYPRTWERMRPRPRAISGPPRPRPALTPP